MPAPRLREGTARRQPSVTNEQVSDAPCEALKCCSYVCRISCMCNRMDNAIVRVPSVPVAAKDEAGLAAVRAITEVDGYEQIAAQYAGHADARRRMSRRRAPSWSDEP